MLAILAQTQEATWGWWHQLAWGWWLLIITAVTIPAGFGLYAGILHAIKRSATRRTRPHDGRAEAPPAKVAQRPPHAPVTT